MPRPRSAKRAITQRAGKKVRALRRKRRPRVRRSSAAKQAEIDALSAGTFTVSETTIPLPEPTTILHGTHLRVADPKLVVSSLRRWPEPSLKPGITLRVVAEVRGRCNNYLFGLRDPVSREAMCFEWLNHELSGCRNSIVEMRKPVVWATPVGAHVYEIVWTAAEVLFYVCGQLVHRSTPAPTAPHIVDVTPGAGEIVLYEVSAVDATGVRAYIVGAPDAAAPAFEPAAAPAPAPTPAPTPAPSPTPAAPLAPADAAAGPGQGGGSAGR